MERTNSNCNQDRDDFRARLRATPYDGELWLDYALFLEHEYYPSQETIDAFTRAQELLPDRDFRPFIGRAYANVNKLDEGVTLIKQSIAERPRASGLCILASVYLEYDMFSEAEAACREAAQLEPTFEEAYYLLGEALRHKSKEDAIVCYRKAIEYDEDYQQAWHALGRGLIANKEALDEGIEALRRALTLDSDDGWSMIFLANAYWKAGRLSEADKWYTKAIAAFPDYDDFKEFYRQFRERTGSHE